MEKIYLKPSVQEILHPGAGKEGSSDLFSYDFESDPSKRKFGNLYLVGNIQGEGSVDGADASYAINLVASLAKREYYAHPDSDPKESFANALKKINDVIEEFFKNKNTRINIGIFTIAGEHIFISKLGKFKIVLSRDEKNIDILNNVALFDKVETQEKEFSNIVSGKIHEGDRILAFYPARSLTSRERTIKAALAKSSPEQFTEKINGLKGKEDFQCAAFHITIEKTKEEVPTYVPPQPQELKPDLEVTLATQDETEEKKPDGTETPKDQVKTKKKSVVKEPPEEVPHIIPSEFSLGRKQNPAVKLLRGIRFNSLSSGRNAAVLGLGLVVVLGLAFFAKSFVLTSPEERQFNAMLEEAEGNLKLAKSKASQNDILGARTLLLTSIATIAADARTDSGSVRNEIYSALDQIDQAVEASPVSVDSLPPKVAADESLLETEWEKIRAGSRGISDAKDVALYENNVYVLSENTISKIAEASAPKSVSTTWLKDPLVSQARHIAVDGNVFVLSDSGTLVSYFKGKKETESQTYLTPSSDTILLTSKDSTSLYLVHRVLGRIHVVNKANGSLEKTLKLGTMEPLLNVTLGENKIFFSTPDARIWMVGL
ncbi:MAG TPA: hypothetical protein VJJ72_00645 [Candidatus Paceibacterota bacterium]